MNKYQEALENIIVYPLKEDCENSPCCQCENQCDFYKMKLHDYDVLKELVDKETPKKPSLSKEECEKACLYLLSHCYEEDLNEDGTYTLTPSGFRESEIFKQLIEEHFKLLKSYEIAINDLNRNREIEYNNPPLKFEELKENMWCWDKKDEKYVRVYKKHIYEYDIGCFYKGQKLLRIYCDSGWYDTVFIEGRFYRKEIKI